MPTDTSERGLERLICTALAGHPCEPPAAGTVAEPSAGYGGVGWSGATSMTMTASTASIWYSSRPFYMPINPRPRHRWDCLKTARCAASSWPGSKKEISKRDTIDVLRRGSMTWNCFTELRHLETERLRKLRPESFYRHPQLHYSRDETQRALDIGLFINGLPVFTFELKNSLTKRTVDDAWRACRTCRE